ncbi:MAG: zf-HC2 domain-containing protein [Bacillota bacterium]
MKCDKIRELLSLYIDQMLDDSQMKEVEKHLAVCAACKKEYNDLKEITELLRQVESVAIPESFEFRLKKALREEKQSIDVGDPQKKSSKKGKWRIMTSIAAVFAVGVISFGLYHDVLGVLPDRLNGGDQEGIQQTGEIYDTKSAKLDNSDQSQEAPSVAMNDQTNELQSDLQIAENETLKSAQGNDTSSQNQKSTSQEESVSDIEDSIIYGLADGAGPDNEEEAGIAADTFEKPKGFAGASEYNSAVTNAKASLDAGCSRSFTVSGVERNVAAVHYYDNLIQQKLDGFDYQILSSNYVQTGEWQFRVFIFRGKDGNTYNEEILVIGKDGEIKVICSNEFMGL